MRLGYRFQFLYIYIHTYTQLYTVVHMWKLKMVAYGFPLAGNSSNYNEGLIRLMGKSTN
jgi:hypothetical protein